jgi:hypothetical protein
MRSPAKDAQQGSLFAERPTFERLIRLEEDARDFEIEVGLVRADSSVELRTQRGRLRMTAGRARAVAAAISMAAQAALKGGG